MASVADDIVTLLKSKTEVVNSPCGTRIFPSDQVPQAMGRDSTTKEFTDSYVVVQQVGGFSHLDHAGHSGKDEESVLISIYAIDKSDAQDVFNAIRPIENYQGSFGTRDACHFDLTLPSDLTEDPIGGAMFAPCWMTCSLRIVHHVTVADWI